MNWIRLGSVGLVVAFLAVLVLPTVGLPLRAQETNWTIEGNTVFVDNSDIYLSATPHTLSGSGWVEFELSSKVDRENYDLIWGFDKRDGVEPTEIQVWTEDVAHEEYRLVEVERVDSLEVENLIDIEVLNWETFEGVPDLGNLNNTYLLRVTANFWGEGFVETLVVACNKYSEIRRTFTYTYTDLEREYFIEYYDDWTVLSKILDKKEVSLGTFDEWHSTKIKTSIKKDQNYRFRAYIEIPFAGGTPVDGEYLWGIKPHGKSIQQASDDGELYILDPWYSASWSYRLEITIDHTKVDTDLVDFPVLITEDNMTATFWAEVKADGTDIVVTSDNAVTKLKREVVSIDNVGETMELWFKATTLSSTVDDIFYLYFGNAGATETNDTDTWDTNYRAVWHKDDDPDNAHIADSTSNANSGNKAAAGVPNEIAGKINVGQEYDYDKDYITVPTSDSLNLGTNDITLEMWIKRAVGNLGNYQWLYKKRGAVAGATKWINLYSYTNDKLYAQIADNNEVSGYKSFGSNAVVQDANWHYVVATFDRDGEGILYVDEVAGVAVDISAVSGSVSNTTNALIGAYSTTIRSFDGIIDEIRISDELRSLGWLGTTFNTCNDPASFYSVAGEALTVPVVETDNADVNGTSATLNGEITDTGYPDAGDTDDERGFVWDTATHADPGNAAPAASGYASNWTEAGDFGTGTFDHEVAGLTELTTYYVRACAHNIAGWSYGDELTFFVPVDGKVYLEFRPDLDETKIREQLGVPSDIFVGEFNGYSLPLYAADGEQLNYIMCVPDRWDGESDILIRIDSALAFGNEKDRSYRWEVLWEHYTSNEDVVPATSNAIYYERYIYSNAQYQSYQDWLVLDYDIDVGDSIETDDLIAVTIRRVTVAPKETDSNEIIVFAVDILFARGDFLADPVGNITTIVTPLITIIATTIATTITTTIIAGMIASGALVGGAGVLFIGLIGLAAFLTWMSYRGRFLPLSVAASLGWIALGIVLLTSPTSVNLDPIGTAWVQPLGFAFFLMALVVLLFQTRTDIRHEATIRRGDTQEVVSWNEKKSVKKRTPTSTQRQRDYKDRLHK